MMKNEINKEYMAPQFDIVKQDPSGRVFFGASGNPMEDQTFGLSNNGQLVNGGSL